MDIYFILNQLRFVFILFLSYLSNGFRKLIAFFDEKPEETKEVKKTETDLFIEKRQTMFLKTFTDTNKDLLQWNLYKRKFYFHFLFFVFLSNII